MIFSKRLPGWWHCWHCPDCGRMRPGWFGADRAGCLLGRQTQVAPEWIPVYVNDRSPLHAISKFASLSPGVRKISRVIFYVSRLGVGGCDNNISRGLICSLLLKMNRGWLNTFVRWMSGATFIVARSVSACLLFFKELSLCRLTGSLIIESINHDFAKNQFTVCLETSLS